MPNGTNHLQIIASLLAELSNLQETGDIRDSIRYSREAQEAAARALGHDSYEAWCEAADAEGLSQIAAKCH